jgi:tetratricopeptide (TPR) repeat protein
MNNVWTAAGRTSFSQPIFRFLALFFLLGCFGVNLWGPEPLHGADRKGGHILLTQLKVQSSTQPELEKAISEYRAENFEEARNLFVNFLTRNPENSQALFYLGVIDKQTGNLPEAVRNLKAVLGIKPPIKEAFVELIDALYNLNQLKEAREWAAKAEAAGSEPAKIHFLIGLIALKEEKNREAVSAFLQAKKMDPSLTEASDFQIAMARVKDRRMIEARDSLKAIMAKDPNSELAAVAREYEKTIGKAVEEYRAWRFSIGLGFQYDTNVVLKPSGGVQAVGISNDNDGSVTNTFKVDYSPLLRGAWFLNGQYSFNSNTYFTIRNYNMMVQSLSLNPGYNLTFGSLSLPLNYSHIWLKEIPYQSIAATKPTLTVISFSPIIQQISVGYSKRTMQQASLNPDEERSGDIYTGTLTTLYPFAEGRGLISFKYEITRDLTDGRNWSNLGNRFTLGLLYPLAKKLSLILTGDVAFQDYDQAHSVYRTPRSDKIYTGSASLVWEIIPQMTLNLQQTFTKADSNIFLYDYVRNVTSLECEYRF